MRPLQEGSDAMHIATVGDVMLDVIVDSPAGLRPDDDTEATITLSAGGQAANVATWAVALGASATLVGPRGTSGAATLVEERLSASGVTYARIPADRTGTVVSILTEGVRTLASDAGDQSWLARVTQTDLPSDIDWLSLSAYPLLRAADPHTVLQFVRRARHQGASISVDLASAGLISEYGAAAFGALLDQIAPDLIFANGSEWKVLGRSLEAGHSDVVVKQGRDGALVRRAGVVTEYRAPVVEVVDATGAGDAFAAGYLVGGPQLALEAAARCVAQLGAQPPAGFTRPPARPARR